MPEGAYDELNFDVEPTLDLTGKTVYVGDELQNVGYIYINESDLRDFLYNEWGGEWGTLGGSDIEWGTDFSVIPVTWEFGTDGGGVQPMQYDSIKGLTTREGAEK